MARRSKHALPFHSAGQTKAALPLPCRIVDKAAPPDNGEPADETGLRNGTPRPARLRLPPTVFLRPTLSA